MNFLDQTLLGFRIWIVYGELWMLDVLLAKGRKDWSRLAFGFGGREEDLKHMCSCSIGNFSHQLGN